MTETKARSIFDTPPDLAVAAHLHAEAEADCAAGRTVPHGAGMAGKTSEG
jgi:hypothetical protein